MSSSPMPSHHVVVRVNTDGSLDGTFGSGGIVAGPAAMNATSILIQSDGKIVCGGTVAGMSDQEFLIVRYDAAGGLDAGFGTGGVVHLAPGFSNEENALVQQADGKLVAAGRASNGFALVRLNESDGSLDSGFGIGGVVLGPFATYGWAHALALRPDGGIIAAGHDSDGSSVNFIALAQYNSDGSLDGSATTTLGSYALANAVVVQPDGKIVAAGQDQSENFALVRYLDLDDTILLSGKRLLLRANSAAAAGKRLRLVSLNEASLVSTASNDPIASTLGGSVRVFTTAGDAFDTTYPLPLAQWQYIGQPAQGLGYKYTNPSGPITRVVFRSQRRLTVVGKGSSLGHTLATNPDPVVVVVTVGARNYCMNFGGTASFLTDRRYRATESGLATSCP